MILTKNQIIVAFLAGVVVLGLVGIYFAFIKDTPKPTPNKPSTTPPPTPPPTPTPPTPTPTPTPTPIPIPTPEECSATNWMCDKRTYGITDCKCKEGTVCNGMMCVPPLLECSGDTFCMLGAVEKCKCKEGTVCNGMKCVNGYGPVSDGKCLDYRQECPGWASLGECNKNPVWMHKNCNKSCKLCTIY